MQGIDVIKCAVEGCPRQIHSDATEFHLTTGLCTHHHVCPYCDRPISENPIGQPCCNDCKRFWDNHESYAEDVVNKPYDEQARLKALETHVQQAAEIRRLRRIILDCFDADLIRNDNVNHQLAGEVLQIARSHTRID